MYRQGGHPDICDLCLNMEQRKEKRLPSWFPTISLPFPNYGDSHEAALQLPESFTSKPRPPAPRIPHIKSCPSVPRSLHAKSLSISAHQDHSSSFIFLNLHLYMCENLFGWGEGWGTHVHMPMEALGQLQLKFFKCSLPPPHPSPSPFVCFEVSWWPESHQAGWAAWLSNHWDPPVSTSLAVGVASLSQLF